MMPNILTIEIGLSSGNSFYNFWMVILEFFEKSIRNYSVFCLSIWISYFSVPKKCKNLEKETTPFQVSIYLKLLVFTIWNSLGYHWLTHYNFILKIIRFLLWLTPMSCILKIIRLSLCWLTRVVFMKFVKLSFIESNNLHEASLIIAVLNILMVSSWT